MPSLRSARASILEASSTDSFLAALVSYAHAAGFGTADATAIIEHADRPREFAYIDNIPSSSEWQSLDPALGARCPVMQHCKRLGTPVVWGRRTYHDVAGVADLYDVCSSLGLASGVSVGVHLPRGRMLQVSMHSDQDLPIHGHHAILHDFVQFAASATAAASDLLLQMDDVDRIQDLTPVELELLRRVAAGQPLERVAHHLSLAESVTGEIAAMASLTLGCSSVQAASLRALRLGII